MSSPDSFHSLLERARTQDRAALGDLLVRHRHWLHQMAEAELAGRLAARLSASDVVQQTSLSAIHKFADFNGQDEAEFAAWLRGVHEHNLQDVIRRHVLAKKRAIGNQQSLEQAEVTGGPAARGHSPSEHAMRDEASAQMLDAISVLPEAQAEAVRLRHLEHATLKEMSERMGRSEVAVASLLKRGLEALRRQLRNEGTT